MYVFTWYVGVRLAACRVRLSTYPQKILRRKRYSLHQRVSRCEKRWSISGETFIFCSTCWKIDSTNWKGKGELLEMFSIRLNKESGSEKDFRFIIGDQYFAELHWPFHFRVRIKWCPSWKAHPHHPSLFQNPHSCRWSTPPRRWWPAINSNEIFNQRFKHQPQP